MQGTEEFTRIAADTLNRYLTALQSKEEKLEGVVNGTKPVSEKTEEFEELLQENIKNELTFGDYLKRTVVECFMNDDVTGSGPDEVRFSDLTEKECIKTIQDIFKENGMGGVGSLYSDAALTPTVLRRYMKKPLGEVGRDVIFLFGLGFNMFADEVDHYLKQLGGGKGFDWKNPEEVIIYYVLKNNRGYQEYVRLREKYIISSRTGRYHVGDISLDVTEEVSRAGSDVGYRRVFEKIAYGNTAILTESSNLRNLAGIRATLDDEDGLEEYLKALKIMKETGMLTFDRRTSVTINEVYKEVLNQYYKYNVKEMENAEFSVETKAEPCFINLAKDAKQAESDPAVPYMDDRFCELLKEVNVSYNSMVARTSGRVDADRKEIILFSFLDWARFIENKEDSEDNHDPRKKRTVLPDDGRLSGRSRNGTALFCKFLRNASRILSPAGKTVLLLLKKLVQSRRDQRGPEKGRTKETAETGKSIPYR